MTGTAIFSVEIELAWGYHDRQRADKYSALSDDRRAETSALNRLLNICDEHEIPISFDVVGHLLLEECSGTHGSGYPDSWFFADPGTESESDPLFYAPDLIDRIQAANVDHEICTHTFSHALGDQFSPHQLNTDLETAQEIHRRELGEPACSLVPPRHQSMDHEVLKHNGIRVVRKTQGKIPENNVGQVRWYFSQNHPVLDPINKDGLVTTYTSVDQSMTAPYIAEGEKSPHPILRSIPLPIRKYLHRLYVEDALDRAIKSGKHAHFWTHLHDMANEAQLDVVERLITLTADRRNRDELRIARMCDL